MLPNIKTMAISGVVVLSLFAVILMQRNGHIKTQAKLDKTKLQLVETKALIEQAKESAAVQKAHYERQQVENQRIVNRNLELEKLEGGNEVLSDYLRDSISIILRSSGDR